MMSRVWSRSALRISILAAYYSRVLKDCENLFVTLGARGLIAQWLQLPTMGEKVIHCTLHKHSISGLTLDGAYHSFQRNYCAACKDRSPRPVDWQHSAEWQEAENERNSEYMNAFRGPTGPLIPPLPLPPELQRQADKE